MKERDIALVDELLNQSAETALYECKHNNADPKTIGTLCSALSNAATFAKKPFAYVLWGVDDSRKHVVGTTFDPDGHTVGNEVFSLWLAKQLSPSVAFAFRTVEHPNGKVVLLEIPATTTVPVAHNNIAYIRIGSATPKLADYPERHQRLIENLRQFVWETGAAKSFLEQFSVLQLLDYSAYFRLTGQPLPEAPAGIMEKLAAEKLIEPDVGGRWNITNLGAILFAHDLSEFDSTLNRKALRFVAYGGTTRAHPVTHRHDGVRGYAVGFAGLLEFMNGLLPKNEHIGEAFRTAQPLFPEIAVRELVANALIHQDMTLTGSGVQIELFSDRLEITNPGESLIEPSRMIDMAPRSRNEALAALMRRMNICEEQGSGLDKTVLSIELFQLPPLKLDSDQNNTRATLYAPRSFADMTVDERVLACYQHAVIKYLAGERMKNASLCARLGIESHNAAQASQVIAAARDRGLIRYADEVRPRAGYYPIWA